MSPAAKAEGETGEAKPDEAARRARRDRNKGKYEAFGKGGDQKGGNRDNRNKPGRDSRNKGKGGAKDGERREWTSAPPRREREVDPDSPFAALAVLKERVKDK